MPKMKSHKGSQKRFSKTGTGKFNAGMHTQATCLRINHRNKSVNCVKQPLFRKVISDASKQCFRIN